MNEHLANDDRYGYTVTVLQCTATDIHCSGILGKEGHVTILITVYILWHREEEVYVGLMKDLCFLKMRST